MLLNRLFIVIAAGNPCRVIRKITEEDKRYWEEKIDQYLETRANDKKNISIRRKINVR